MPELPTLESGHCYHIYNRGNGGENIFREERNYSHFLTLYSHHIEPAADTFAYCLLRNHFHLLVRIKERGEYPFSSYHTLVSDRLTMLKRDEVLRFFNGRAEFEALHRELTDDKALEEILSEDPD